MAEIQLLSALMMRNTTENKFVHVFSPSITKIMQNAFQWYHQIKHNCKTDGLHAKLKGNLHSLCDYIECVSDLFEHKFLVFLCDCTETHWYTFVVVNPSVIYLRGHSSKKWKGNNGLFGGWSVFDSTGWSKGNQPNARDSSSMMTTECTFDTSGGIAVTDQEEQETQQKSELDIGFTALSYRAIEPGFVGRAKLATTAC